MHVSLEELLNDTDLIGDIQELMLGEANLRTNSAPPPTPPWGALPQQRPAPLPFSR